MEAVRREAEPGDGERDEPDAADDGEPSGGVAGIPVMDLAPDATDGALGARAAEIVEPAVDAEPVAEPPRIIVPKTPGVLADDHLAEAARKVLRFHLARMITREAGTRAGKDPEELHGMRVATRRQRAAWRVFGDAFDLDRTDRYRRRLKLVAARPGRRARPRRADRGR